MFRMQNNLPKVGIRPVIDGRRNGVRESLEDTTMNMAKIAAKLIEDNIKHPSGEKVDCVIADTTIGGVAEAARCQKKFDENNVKLTLTVTPCWCYGSETIDMTPAIPKAIWGFNGTERPGAVYLAAADAGHTQLGLPVFSIYGKDVQDAGDENIPDDVKEKILRFVKAGLAVATMKDQSYISMGYVAMGIMGSMVDAEFLLDYLGMRTEFVDMSEIKRRLELEIYDKEEFQKAWEWAKQCKFGVDKNKVQATPEEKEKEWATSIKMAMIMRDLMVGNPKLAEMGYIEEAQGHNAIVGGFQGQRHWTDFMPNGDFAEAILNSSFDWNGIREPYVVATENDSLNGLSMLFAHLLTSRSQLFADVRTYWSPEAVKRVTGKELTGKAKDGIIHLINSGAASLDWTGEQKVDGNPALKEYWNITEDEAKKLHVINGKAVFARGTVYSDNHYAYCETCAGGFSGSYICENDLTDKIKLLPTSAKKLPYNYFLYSTGKRAYYELHLPKDILENKFDVRLEFEFDGLNLQVFSSGRLINDYFNIDGKFVMCLRDYEEYIRNNPVLIIRTAPKTKHGISNVYNEIPVKLYSNRLELKKAQEIFLQKEKI